MEYFNSKPVYVKLFKAFRKKFRSLGRFGGSVKLVDYQTNELESLASFLGVSINMLANKGQLKISDFEMALFKTKFGGLSLHAILESFYGEELVSNRTSKERKDHLAKERMEKWRLRHQELEGWLIVLEQRSHEVLWIWRLMEEPYFEGWIQDLARASTLLPTDYERLPFFAQRITGNPHAFDLHTVNGKMLLHFLHVKAGRSGAMPSKTEDVNDLLLRFRILRDDLSNDVSVANLIGALSGEIHPVWRAACEWQTAWNVPLREVVKLDAVRTSKGDTVYIVENSGVFSALLDAKPETPLICTHGQFNLAALKLMDMLTTEGMNLLYAGDFDPEGLLMAQSLLNRYPGHVALWRMDLPSYVESVSEQSIESRLVKLNGIENTELMDVVEKMKILGKAGYQEALLTRYVEDIELNLNK